MQNVSCKLTTQESPLPSVQSCSSLWRWILPAGDVDTAARAQLGLPPVSHARSAITCTSTALQLRSQVGTLKARPWCRADLLDLDVLLVQSSVTKSSSRH